MKQTKLFIGVGALVLACGAVVSAKPAKKFVSFNAHIVGISTGGANQQLVLTNTLYTTVKGTNKTAFIMTVGQSAPITVLTGTAGSHAVYFK